MSSQTLSVLTSNQVIAASFRILDIVRSQREACHVLNALSHICSAWLENSADPLIQAFDTRIGAMTGLNMNTAESLQV